MNKVILFTTSMCPKCPEAKKFISDNNLEVEIITADKDKNGMELATKYGVQYVPAFVVLMEEDEDEDTKVYTLNEFKQLKMEDFKK